MRRLPRWFPGVLIVGLGLSLLVIIVIDAPLSRAQEQPTATPNINWVSALLGVNVRSGPGTNYRVIAQLQQGAWVQPIARSADSEWVLITHLYTQGWVTRAGVNWRLNPENLPAIETFEPTPILVPLYQNTPDGPTPTPNANWVRGGQDGVIVRSGPGQGYIPVGALFTGDVVDPVARDTADDWILIRYDDGYGWVRYDLVVWADDVDALRIIDVPNLTPTITPETPTSTLTSTPTPNPTDRPVPSRTPSPTHTITATATITHTATNTSTSTVTPSATVTSSPTATTPPTATPTTTASATSSMTLSPLPSATLTRTPVPTNTATERPTSTASPTAAPSATTTPEATTTETPVPEPSKTPTNAPTATNTPEPTHTATSTPQLTITATPSTGQHALAQEPSPTLTDLPSSPTPSAKPTAAPSSTPSPNPTEIPSTATPEAAVRPDTTNNSGSNDSGNSDSGDSDSGDGETPPLSQPDATQPTRDASDDGSALSLLLGGGLAALVLLYAGTYVIQSALIGQYDDGFALTDCPVCSDGHLHLDTRRYTVLGIPRTRRVVRCDNCNSVLRQIGRQRWRYAVDRMANPALYDHFNGRTLTENQILELSTRDQGASPEYIEGDQP